MAVDLDAQSARSGLVNRTLLPKNVVLMIVRSDAGVLIPNAGTAIATVIEILDAPSARLRILRIGKVP